MCVSTWNDSPKRRARPDSLAAPKPKKPSGDTASSHRGCRHRSSPAAFALRELDGEELIFEGHPFYEITQQLSPVLSTKTQRVFVRVRATAWRRQLPDRHGCSTGGVEENASAKPSTQASSQQTPTAALIVSRRPHPLIEASGREPACTRRVIPSEGCWRFHTEAMAPAVLEEFAEVFRPDLRTADQPRRFRPVKSPSRPVSQVTSPVR